MFYLKGKVREFFMRNDCRYYQRLKKRSDGEIGIDSIKEETYQINLNNRIRNKLCVLIYKPKGFSQVKHTALMLCRSRKLSHLCNLYDTESKFFFVLSNKFGTNFSEKPAKKHHKISLAKFMSTPPGF